MITAYTDGACRGGNPGFCACAYVMYDGDKEISTGCKYLGPERHTNNFSEYSGLLLLLHHLEEHRIKKVTIYSDSKIVIGQVNQEFEINNPTLKVFAAEAYALMVRGGHRLLHCKGHNGILGNERADQLCNEILDASLGPKKVNKKAQFKRMMEGKNGKAI